MSAPIPPIKTYIDLMTDFGFKRIFSAESNKDLLMDLLNSIFRGKKHITHFEFYKNEEKGETKEDGGAIFDLTCVGENNEKFIIEVQRASQKFFMKRALFYTSLATTSHAPHGLGKKWGYNLPEIYFIGVLEDFSITPMNPKYFREGRIMDVDTNEILSNDLVFFFLELINFTKEESELVTNLDKWLYLFKNISKLDKIPAAFQTDIFEKVFHIAAYRNMNKEEKHMYDLSLKHKWDSENKLDYATEQGILKGREEGREEGRAEGIVEGIAKGIAKGRAEGRAEGIAVERNNTQQRLNGIVHYFHTIGKSVDEIASITQLSKQEVEEIIQLIV